MIFTQHYLACLSHASYLVGDETTGRAVVVDPRRDVGRVPGRGGAHGVDDRAGHRDPHPRRLPQRPPRARRRDRRRHLLRRGRRRSSSRSSRCTTGSGSSLGDVTLEVLATPGHTPESICIVVYEHADDDVPYGVLTGDTLFVGDVGRPDLLAAGRPSLSADALARQLYRSLHDKLLPTARRDPGVPGPRRRVVVRQAAVHRDELDASASSARTNYALQPMGEDEFVAVVTEGQPARPHYFEFDAQTQPRGPRAARRHAAAAARHRRRRSPRRADGAVLLDAREPADFAAGHLRGAVNVGLQGRFAEWAGDVLSPDREIVLVGDPAAADRSQGAARPASGYDRVVGQLADPGRRVRAAAATSIETQLAADDRAVRRAARARARAAAGRRAQPRRDRARDAARRAGDPARRARRLARGRSTATTPVVVYCASGYRSQIAASVLAEAGFSRRVRSARRVRRVGGRRPAGHRPGRRRGRPTARTSAPRAGQGAGRRRRAAARRARARRVAGAARARTPCWCRWGRSAPVRTSCRATGGSWSCAARAVARRPITDVAARLGLRRRQPRRRDVRVGVRRPPVVHAVERSRASWSTATTRSTARRRCPR